MRASKPLIIGTLGVFASGVAYDAIKGVGQHHTVPRVPAGISIAVATSTSSADINSIYVGNNVTGEEIRAFPPAANYSYIVGLGSVRKPSLEPKNRTKSGFVS
jgi:hypothetical protein